MTTRSTILAVATVSDESNVVLYQAPADRIVLLKDIRWMVSTGVRAGAVGINLSHAGILVGLISESAPTQYKPEFWEGWVVLEPGDYILGISQIQTTHFWISGAELPPTSAALRF